jgi:hypothetical protein
MAPLGLDDRVAVKAGAKTRPYADYYRSVGYFGSQVFFRHHGVNQNAGPEFSHYFRAGIDKEGDLLFLKGPAHFIFVLYQEGGYVLHLGPALIDRPAKGDRPADRRGGLEIGHGYIEARVA